LMTAIIRALDLVQRAPGIGTKLLVRLAIPAGFEPATLCLEVRGKQAKSLLQRAFCFAMGAQRSPMKCGSVCRFAKPDLIGLGAVPRSRLRLAQLGFCFALFRALGCAPKLPSNRIRCAVVGASCSADSKNSTQPLFRALAPTLMRRAAPSGLRR
jgi:hypothetical protein